MKRRVDWSALARAELKEQIAFISHDNPRAARQVADEIRAAAGRLSDLASGRPGRVAGTWELVLSRYPYILVYTLTDDDQISITRLLHTAREYPGHEG